MRPSSHASWNRFVDGGPCLAPLAPAGGEGPGVRGAGALDRPKSPHPNPLPAPRGEGTRTPAGGNERPRWIAVEGRVPPGPWSSCREVRSRSGLRRLGGRGVRGGRLRLFAARGRGDRGVGRGGRVRGRGRGRRVAGR